MTLNASIAANRFGLGARPGELSAIGTDAREWLARQVEGSRPTPEVIRVLPSSAEVLATFVKQREERRERRKDEAASAQGGVQNIRKQLVPRYLDQVVARYATATRAEESFRERLVHFWTNHFAISAENLVGTRELYQSRDLQPTLDLRSVFKGLALAHLGASERDVE